MYIIYYISYTYIIEESELKSALQYLHKAPSTFFKLVSTASLLIICISSLILIDCLCNMSLLFHRQTSTFSGKTSYHLKKIVFFVENISKI